MLRTAPILLLLASLSSSASAQELPPPDSIAVAVALRDSGHLERARDILRRKVDREPANGDAARALAQTLYWMKDVAGATEIYEAAIARIPDDTSLRLEYARMLVETRSDSRAREILVPLTGMPATRARALTVLGISQYWQGDLASASNSFRKALAADSNVAEAGKLLEEIRHLSSSWVAIGSSGLQDDQPVDRIGGEAETGWFINPLLSTSARIRPIHFRIADSASVSVVSGDVGISHYAPAARLETKIGVGAVYRSAGETSADWTARAAFRFRLPNALYLDARAERAPYLSTIASVRDPIMSESGAIAFGLNAASGWLGEAALRVERFPDDNSVTSTYVWALAPVVRASQLSMSIGYSFAMQDAKATRFTKLNDLPDVLDPASTYTIIARYEPYYTPENVVSHSALASLTVRPSPKTTINARGGYGFHAKEDAPIFFLIPAGSPSFGFSFVERTFHPWDAHIAITTVATPALTVSATIDRFRTAFYTATTAGVRFEYRFIPTLSH